MEQIIDPTLLEKVKKENVKRIDDKIIDLKSRNRNITYIQGGLAFAGSIGGLIYAINSKKSFLGKVGFWFLGGLIVGVPSAIAANFVNNNRNTEIEKLELEKNNINN